MCNKERFWQALAAELGHPGWTVDARFSDYAARLANRAALERLLDQALSGQSTAHWLQRFAGKVPAAPVNDVAQALESGYVRARGSVRAYLSDWGETV